MLNGVQNLDANESIFFDRELSSIRSKSYDVRYPELKATQLIPVTAESGPGAEVTIYASYNSFGVAKLISSYAKDLPRVDVKGQEFTARIRSVGDSYGYNIQEIRAAQKAGKPLDQMRANAARRAIAEKMNALGFFGDSNAGLQGFLNHPNVTRLSAPADGASSATTFASKDATKILRDLNNCVNSIVTLTNGVEAPNTLLMPLAQYTQLTTTNAGTGTDTTILQYFMRNTPYITEVIPVWQLKDAGIGVDGGVSAGEDMIVAYNRSPDKLQWDMPIEFESFAPQLTGLEYEVPCHGRVGSVLYYYPLSCAMMEGV